MRPERFFDFRHFFGYVRRRLDVRPEERGNYFVGIGFFPVGLSREGYVRHEAVYCGWQFDVTWDVWASEEEFIREALEDLFAVSFCRRASEDVMEMRCGCLGIAFGACDPVEPLRVVIRLEDELSEEFVVGMWWHRI